MINKENQSQKLMKLSMLMLQNELKQLISDTVKLEIQNELFLMESRNELLTLEEVCKTYKFSKSTIERYVREGLPYSSNGKGCKRLFRKSDLEKFKKIKNGR
ncbi:helix-turn-helix domain-containing protein [Flavobacterium antarcticum]|uniref:helix-turn-helix domain-containing protein n=1 Tax=Flavobacterium antarcticum TaxID=271155 RepID=UPI0003B4CEFB|nr:helix-turn-helix domain-containing protein [Flavobacterium antarcticum]